MSVPKIKELKNFPESLDLKRDNEGNCKSDEVISTVVVETALSTNVLLKLILPEQSSITFQNDLYTKEFGPEQVDGEFDWEINWKLKRTKEPKVVTIKMDILTKNTNPPHEKDFGVRIIDINDKC